MPLGIPGLGGPMPPQGASPGGVGAASQPGGMPGSQAQGVALVKTAVDALQKAIPQLQMGSEIHTAVLKATADLSKNLEKAGVGGKDPASVVQQLVELMRNAKQNPNAMAALPPMGGGPGPMMPPMGGGGEG